MKLDQTTVLLDMQTGKEANFARQLAVEELVNIIRLKEAEVSSFKNQVEQLHIQLSKYKEKDDSPTEKQSQRTQLLRAKSDPVCPQSRKKSNPEIFVFPESQDNVKPNIQPVMSHLVLGIETSNDPQSLSTRGVSNKPPESSLDLRSHIPASWLDPSLASQGCPGVSELYFKNLLNELIKTKKYVNNLLTQKQGPDKTVELNNLKQEVQQLVFVKQHLERELDEVKDDNTKLRKQLLAGNRVGLAVETGKQTDHQVDMSQESVQMLSSQLNKLSLEKQNLLRDYEYNVGNLLMENERLKKEREELQISQKNLSTQVVSLSTLLQEEGKKNKGSEESLRNKTTEATELSQKLCILRQKYEELMEEKNALEKNLALTGSMARQHYGTGNTMSGRTSSQDRHLLSRYHGDSPKNSFGGRNSSGGSKPFSAQPQPQSLIRDQRRPHTSGLDFPQNNLSPREPGDRKPLNILASLSLPRPGELASEYECPTCQQNFTTEISYQSHLEKCIE